jgi:hypothetical protein
MPEFLQDPAFWWAVVASIWAVASDYMGADPRIKANGVTQLLISMIGNVITGQTKEAGRRRRIGRR